MADSNAGPDAARWWGWWWVEGRVESAWGVDGARVGQEAIHFVHELLIRIDIVMLLYVITN